MRGSDSHRLSNDTSSRTGKGRKLKKISSFLISVALVINVFSAGRISAVVKASAQQRSPERGGSSGARIRFVPRQVRLANKKLRYTVKARYPQAVGAATDPRLKKLNQELKTFITKEVSRFTTDFQAPDKQMFRGSGSYFDASYGVEFATHDLVSIEFGISTYFEGAAHGNNNTVVFNYDLNTDRRLKLADLFKPKSDYLKPISDYAVKFFMKKLVESSDSEWIKNGAGPKEENYQSWNVTSKGLKVTFDPYQVASFADGPQEVTIPYSVLKNVIDPAGPLARVVR